MKHRLLSLLTACCMAMTGFSAVNYVLNESFEEGIPAGWTQEVLNDDYESSAWVIDDVATNPNGAADGDHRLALRSNGENYQVRLITPELDLTGVNAPQLSFAYAQFKRNGVSDSLFVYFRPSADAAWQSMRKLGFTTDWVTAVLDLPAAAKTATCQFAFDGMLNGGYGVVLDAVRVFPASQCTDAVFSDFFLGATSAFIAWEDRPSRKFELIVSTASITNLSTYDHATDVFYANDLEGTDVMVEGLTPTTKYYVYLRTDCDDNESGHTNWISTSFTTAIGVPYAPVLSALPSTWKRYTGPTTVSVNASGLTTTTSGWTATTSTTVLGTGHLYASPSTNAYWVTTPAIELSVDADATVAASFDLAYTGGSTSASASSYVSSAKFHVYVAAADGEIWTLARTIAGSNLSNEARTFHVLLDAHKGTSIRLAFVAEGTSSNGYMHFGKLRVDEVDPSCLGITDLKPVTTSNSINLSWKVTGTNTNAVAVLSSSATFADTLDIQNVSVASASFAGLEPYTTYYVSVRQVCEAGNTLTAEVKTPCLASTITKEEPWTEGFEGYTGTTTTATNGIVPDCWSASADGTNKPHIVTGTGTYVYKHDGSNSLYFHGSGNCYAVLPGFTNALNTLQISFWARMENVNNGVLTLGYITAGDVNMNTFTPIKEYTSSTTMVSYETELDALPADAEYLVFRWYYSGQYCCCIDDITISLLPNCRKVQDVAISAITGTSAEVAFAENGAAQYEVLVVNQPMNPDTLQTESLVAHRETVTASPLAISDLNPASVYYVYVRALCGEEDGAWSAAASFMTECGEIAVTKTQAWLEDFESYTGSAYNEDNDDLACWLMGGNTTHKPHVASSGTYGYYCHSGSKTLSFYGSSNSTSYAALPKFAASLNEMQISFWIRMESASAGAMCLGYITDTDPGDFSTFQVFDSLTSVSTMTQYEKELMNIPAEASRLVLRWTYSGSSYYTCCVDDIELSMLPTCNRMGSLSVVETTSSSATLRFDPTNASQYQVVVTNISINPDTLANVDLSMIVYNDKVYVTQPTISSLDGNTRYYAYVRGFCGGDDYSTWSAELSFKTNCDAITPAAFGVESFDDPASIDCWTLGFTHPGTSTSSAYAQRDSVKAYGAYLKLSKESVAYTKNAAGVDTVYSDGAYAISPMLDMDDISNYQVSFMAATFNNTATTNYKRLNIGIITNPSDLSTIVVLKTIDLDYAADSTALKSYTVSFTDYEGDYLGEMGKYVIFQLNEPSKRDSTNFVLIDNVSFELASSCQQVLEAKMDSVGVEGAKISWENTGASEYEVMLASINSLRPDTISNPIDTKQVSTTAAELDALTGNTIYYAYVRGICGEDTAKWSNSIRFRTSIGIPYDEPFSTTTLSDGWQSLYGKFSGDTILTSALTTPTGDYKWSIVSASLPTGMTAPAAYGYIYDYTTGDPWLISPAIDLRGHENDNIELTVDLARSITAETDASFFVIISEDGGLTWAKANATTWSPSGGDYGINELPTTATNFTISLTKYAGKKIALAFYLHATNGSKKNYHGIYVDNISVHTFEAVCRGLANVSVTAAADSAKVMWTIEGIPAKAAVEIYSDATFTTRLDSVGVEDAYEHTFTGLTPQTTYYVRAKQLDCEDAEWKSAVFTTKCMPVATLPMVEDFEDYTGVAYNEDGVMPDCWIAAGDASVLPHVIGGSGSYVFKHSGSNALTFYGSGNCYAVLPAVEAELNTLQISFWMQTESASYGKLTLGYITEDDVDMNTFTPIEVYANNSGSMIERETSLAAISDSAKYLVFHWNYSSQWSCCIDDVVLDLIPACPKATGLGVDSIVADSARLFVADLGARGYEFIVATAELNLLAMTAADSANIIFNDSIIGDTAMFVTNLNPVTSYYVYARALCDEGKMGAWSAAKSFVSACSIINVAEGSPFVQNFNALTSGIPSCWDNTRGTVDDSYKWAYYATGYDGACLRFNSYNAQTELTDTLVTPALFLQEDAILSFYWKNPTGGDAEVLISTDGGVTKTVLESNLTAKSSWTLYEKNLSAYTGQTIQIFFASTSNYGTGDAYHYLDNFKVAKVPTCLPVTSVSYELTMGDGTIASINWTAADTSSYVLQYSTAADFVGAVEIPVSDTTAVALSDLTPETTYYARVKVICDATSESEWSDPISFMPTNAYTLTINDGTATNGYVPFDGYDADGGESSSQFIIPASSLTDVQWGTITQLTFYTSTTSASFGSDTWAVYAAETSASTLTDLVDWNTLTKVRNAATVSVADGKMVITFDTPFHYENGNLLIGFEQTGGYTSYNISWTGITATSGVSYYSYSYYYYGSYYTDDGASSFLPKMTIDYIPGEEPACFKPTGLTAELTMGDGSVASLSWNTEAAKSVIQYATSADFTNAVTDTIIDTTAVALSGLTPETTYYARVLAICEGDIPSDWTDAISFIPTNALSLTINNGTLTNEYIPLYGFYCDYGTQGQFIIPADSLEALQWDTITKLTFYSSDASISWGSAQFEVYMAEVPSTSISALADWSSLTKVMNAGSLSIVDNQMVVTLSTPFQYTDGNLLIGIKESTNGSYKSAHWYGVTATGASYGGSNSNPSQRNFLPMMTIDYIEGEEPACIKPSGLVANKITATSAEIGFKASKAPEYELVLTNAAINPDTLLLVADSIIVWRDTVDTNRVAISGLQQQTEYYAYVRGLCSETEVSEWISAQFSTKCLASLPFTENFDDATDRKAVYEGTSSYTIPSCWNEGYSSKSYVSYIQDNATSATYAYSGTSALRLYSTSSDSSYVVLPELEGVSLDTLQLTFKARAMYMGSSSYTNYASSTFAHSVKVGTLTDPDDFSTFQLLDTYVLDEVASPASSDDYWEDATIFLQGATGKYIALVSDFEKSNYVWIDDVEISRAPECIAPSAIAVSTTVNAADVTWNSSASAFEVALCQAGVLPINADSIYAVENVTNLHIEDLTPSTDYDLYVRAVCGENLTSDWSKVTRFTTSFGDNWDDDFESANTWTLINGSNTNAWAWGEAVANGGTHALYISNDDGASHAYTNNSAAMVYAVKLLDFEDGKYQFTYDWLANGESTYDYLRVALVPASVTLTAGTSVPSGFSASGLPTGWIALDGGSKLNLSEEWQTKSVAVRVSAGAYYVVLAWRDDTSTGTNPPAAVDNFSIAKLACGYDVENLALAATPAITTSTAAIQWKHNANVAEWQVVYASDAAFSADKTDTLVVDTAYAALSGLHASTTYYVKVRALCSAEEAGSWSNAISFTTSCDVIEVGDAGWFESFNDLTSGIPTCWDNAEGTTTSASSKWSYYSTGYDGVGVRFNSFSNTAGYTNILATPELALTKGMELSFWWKNPTGGNAEVLIAANGGSRVTLVTDLTGVAEWTKYEIDLSDYTGDTVVIYFKGTSNYGNGDAYLYLDEVAVAPLPDCRAVRDLSVSNISMSGARLTFRFTDGQEHTAHVAISQEAAFDPATAMLIDTIADSTYYFNVALESRTTYYMYARQDCGEGNVSAWKQVAFRTDCEALTALPWSEGFEEMEKGNSTSDAPECWRLLNANQGDYPYVYVNNSSAYVQTGSQSLYFQSSSTRAAYAILPDMNVPMDQLQVSFAYRNEGTSDSNGTLSFGYMTDITDGGSYVELVECKRTTTFTTVSVATAAIPQNLANSVRLAFRYTGGTANNYYAAVDDIRINSNVVLHYDATICDGNDYVGSNDGNSLYITPDEYHVGLNEYTKTCLAPEGSGQPDTLYTLSLNVMAIETLEDSVVLCEGEQFSQIINGADFTFVAKVGMPDQRRYVDNGFGCENIVILHILAVNPKVEEHIYDSVALGEQYEWHGEIYVSATDAQFDTLSVVTGCDSTVYLHLSVYQKEEALHGVHAQDLLIAPNPVHVGEPIRVLNDFLAEDLKEARIEIYSTTGALYYVQHGADQPFILPAIEVSGMYYVRVLIDDQIYLSTLLVQ